MIDMRKGVSPLIATVLLIAFTIAVGGIISVWLTQFAGTTTETVGKESQIQITCGTGGIAFNNVNYCNNNLSGEITNTGSISLGNITFTVLYTNSSRELFYVNYSNGAVNKQTSCCGNMVMFPAEKFNFNFPIGGSNYEILRVTTNCTTVRVSDEVSINKNEIIKAC